MSYEKFKAWAKFIFIIVLIIVALIIVVMNSNNSADLWLFYRFESVPVLWLLIVTAVVSPILWAIVRNVYRAYRDVARYSRESKESKRKEPSNNKGENVEVEQ